MPTAKISPNIRQLECINNIDGIWLVLAGPGTGKTFTIIQRIFEMIKRGVNPSGILCLTFTDAASGEMKVRLEKLLKENDIKLVDEPKIKTYHSFCSEIIENNIDEFELPNNFRIINESTSRVLIKECIDEINPKAFRTTKNDPYYFIGEIKNKIEEIKKYRLTKEKYFENIKNNPDWEIELKRLEEELTIKKQKGSGFKTLEEVTIPALKKKIEKACELWDFYELYSQKMYALRYLDFSDMINFVLDKFEKNPAFLNKIANEYEYVLVDEYQDTNASQNEIIFNLARALNSKNIFVVGDDDQIIYSFQGARLDSIENFLNNFPSSKVICLNENMRSNQNILDVSRCIANLDSKRLENNKDFEKYNIDKNLIAKNSNLPLNKVKITGFNDIEEEYLSIVDEIDKLSKEKENLSEIAILAKSNAELDEFAQMLKNRNIPYELKEGKDIFEIRPTLVLFYYMQFLLNPEKYSGKLAQLLLLEPFKFHPNDFEKIQNCFSFNKSLIENTKMIDNFIQKEKINKFVETFEYLQKYIASENIVNSVFEIASKTGIFDYYLNCEIERSQNIASIKKIIEEAKSFMETNKLATLADFVSYLKISLDDEIKIKTSKAPVSLNAIQLSTYHSAKGREFEIVFMPTLTKRKWESSSSRLKPEIPLDISEYKTEEELKAHKQSDLIKVMYVGMTRAKHTLNLSYIKGTKSSLIQNLQTDNAIEELEKENHNVQSYWENIKNTLIKRDYDYKNEFNSIIKEILKQKYFSATSINTYINCPRQYLYKEILKLDSNSEIVDNMQYGTAIHASLQYAFDYAIKNNVYPNADEIISAFKKELSKLPLSGIENRKNLEKRGKDAIQSYYLQFTSCPISRLVEAEKGLIYELDDETKFKGIIDRIEKNEDGTYTICDYKTGNSKSIKKISLDGDNSNYYIQIGLYKLFFERLTDKKVKSVKFIFPEDCTKNLEFSLDETEIKEIEKIFLDAVQNIKSCNFEPSEDKNSCRYCQFKAFCNFNVL